MSKLVRVDDELYARLHRLAGKIQSQKGKPVSISDAIRQLMDKPKRHSPVGKIIPPARFTRKEGAKEAVEKMEERLTMGLKKGEQVAEHAFKEFSFKHGKFV
jgi:predicted CopG family antitoxin